MPGGFTWADAFHGFSEAVLLAVSIGGVVAAVAVVVVVLLGLGVLCERRLRFQQPVAVSPQDAIRAMAHERVARHEAIAYDHEPPFTGRADWPEREAS